MGSRLNKKIVLFVLCILLFHCNGCHLVNEDNSFKEMHMITDGTGNHVEVSLNIEKVAVTPMPWSAAVYAIDKTSEHISNVNPGVKAAYRNSCFKQIDEEFFNIPTDGINSDCSINVEELLSENIQVVVIWDWQTDAAKQLIEVGITPVMVKNHTFEDLHASIRAIGQVLNKEERAQQFIDYYNEVYNFILNAQQKIASADKPKILYLRTADLELQGNDNFISTALDLTGADNVAKNISQISMEEIIVLNPDIILLSCIDTFKPDDLYNNTIVGQDWSLIKAVQNKHVYKTPQGIFRWDAPGVETPLMMLWLAKLIQPDIFNDIDIREKIKEYYYIFFDYTLSEKDIDQILNKEFNSNSQLWEGMIHE